MKTLVFSININNNININTNICTIVQTVSTNAQLCIS